MSRGQVEAWLEEAIEEFRTDPSRTSSLAARALAAAAQGGHRDLEARAHNILGGTYYERGWLLLAERELQRNLELVPEANSVERFRLLSNLGSIRLHQQDHEETARLYEGAADVAEALSDVPLQVSAALKLSAVSLGSGHPRWALHQAEEALKWLARSEKQDLDRTMQAHLAAAAAHLDLGEPGQALVQLKEPLAPQAETPLLEARWHQARAAALLALGRLEQAQQEGLRAEALVEALGPSRVLAEVLDGLGRSSEERAQIRQALEYRKRQIAVNEELERRASLEALRAYQASREIEVREDRISELRAKSLQWAAARRFQMAVISALAAAALLGAFVIATLVRLRRAEARVRRELEDRQCQLKERNQALRQAVDQKELLSRELHHRVKNNFELFLSLLGLQRSRASSAQAKEALRTLERRVRALLAGHALLDPEDALGPVGLYPFLMRLARHAADFAGTDPDQIQVHVGVDRAMLPEQAVRLGLVVNELVTNALMHGYGGDPADAEVRIELYPEEEGDRLEVLDRGVGGAASSSGSGLGLSLVRSLSAAWGHDLIVSERDGGGTRACLRLQPGWWGTDSRVPGTTATKVVPPVSEFRA